MVYSCYQLHAEYRVGWTDSFIATLVSFFGVGVGGEREQGTAGRERGKGERGEGEGRVREAEKRGRGGM